MLEDLFHTLLGWQTPDYSELGLVNSVQAVGHEVLCGGGNPEGAKTQPLVYKVSVINRSTAAHKRTRKGKRSR